MESGTGLRSAADYLVPYIEKIQSDVTAVIDFPIGKYNLTSESVLDAIGNLVATSPANVARIYDLSHKKGTLKLGEFATNGIEGLFAKSESLDCTFNVEKLEEYIPEFAAFAIDLGAVFGARVAVHAFVSGRGVSPTPLHYDFSDAFTFQLIGSKHWQSFRYNDKPSYGYGYVVNKAAVGERYLDHVIRPGECLFVPKGALHLVGALPDSPSVHLAVSIKPLGAFSYLAQILDPELNHPDWAGTDFPKLVARLAAQLEIATHAPSDSDAVRTGRNALWHLLYDAHSKCGLAKRLPRSGGKLLRRRLGSPLHVAKSEHSFVIEYIDPGAEGPVGVAGFAPARIELPLEAAPFVDMLECGEFSNDHLKQVYGEEDADYLSSIAVDIGVFEENPGA